MNHAQHDSAAHRRDHHAHDHADPAALERDLQARREHISQLVGALEDKLSPGAMFEKVWHGGKDNAGEFARNLGHAVKANPVPSLLTAAGMAWLYAGKDRDMVAADGSGGSDHHRLHDAAGAVRERARRTRDGTRQLYQDNPLAIGAVAVAAGALLGALLPESHREQAWVEQSDADSPASRH